jgi:hypothetical protein
VSDSLVLVLIRLCVCGLCGRVHSLASSVLAQVGFSAVSLVIVGGLDSLGSVPIGVWVIMGVGPVLAFGVDCLLWWRWRLWWTLRQLQLKLEFEVRLGMHSPVASPACITPLLPNTPLASPAPFTPFASPAPFTPQVGTPFSSH